MDRWVSHPKAVVEEAVDDRVDKAVRHGEPVNGIVDGNEDLMTLLVHETRVEVYDERESVQRRPTQPEQTNHYRQHLDRLKYSVNI